MEHPSQLIESMWRVVVNTDGSSEEVLDFGDLMTGPIALATNDENQVEGFIEGLGIVVYPRGNRFNALAFVRCEEFEAVVDAAMAQISALAFPDGNGTLSIEVENSGGNATMDHATIESIDTSTWDRFTQVSMSIPGGLFTNGITFIDFLTDDNGEPMWDDSGDPILAA